MSSPLEHRDAVSLQECVAGGGVAVFPTDTVYGLCCDPDSEAAVRKLYELKGRPAARPAAVMFFALDTALKALSELGGAERAALGALLPGAVTVLLVNRGARFAPACGPDPATLGLRVPNLPDRLAALGSVTAAVMQSSANISGGPDPRRLAEVPDTILEGVDLVLDGGELAGQPSTVVDLRDYQARREWRIVRQGAVSERTLREALGPDVPER